MDSLFEDDNQVEEVAAKQPAAEQGKCVVTALPASRKPALGAKLDVRKGNGTNTRPATIVVVGDAVPPVPKGTFNKGMEFKLTRDSLTVVAIEPEKGSQDPEYVFILYQDGAEKQSVLNEAVLRKVFKPRDAITFTHNGKEHTLEFPKPGGKPEPAKKETPEQETPENKDQPESKKEATQKKDKKEATQKKESVQEAQKTCDTGKPDGGESSKKGKAPAVANGGIAKRPSKKAALLEMLTVIKLVVDGLDDEDEMDTDLSSAYRKAAVLFKPLLAAS
jgi:hypothetical protein